MRSSPDTKPNPIKTALSKAIGALRADDDMLEVLNAFAALEPDALEKLDPGAARRNPTPADAVNSLLRRQGRDTNPEALVPGVRTADLKIPAAGGPLAARAYIPSGNGPFPVVLYFHGGGWVIASKEVYDGGARSLAKAANSIVVSVDYRLAPEHRFPAAWEDAVDAYRWLTSRPRELPADGGPIAIAGESAGGNLALNTAIAARDAGLPRPAHVLAVYPVAQTSRETESYLENAIAVPLNRAMMEWFFEHTINSPADLEDPRLNLINAHLEGLPPVTLISARLDPLRSDSSKLETALRAADVPVELRDYEGVAHEFFGMGAVVAKAREAVEFAAERLRASFRPDTRTGSGRLQ